MPHVDANGLRIEYDERGSGEPLLLVMGLGSQMILWHDSFIDLLVERGFRVIRYDNRDIGGSTHLDREKVPSVGRTLAALLSRRWAKAPYLLSDMAADGVGLLAALGIEQAHVVGASMGGMIAQTMAIEHPNRVRSLTSIMSNTGDRRAGQAKFSVLRRLAAGMRKRPADRVEATVATFRLISGPHFNEDEARLLAKRTIERGDDEAGTGRQLAATMASPNRTAGLRSLRVPTLVIHGMVDPLVKPSGGRATATAVPGAELLMFNDMGHDMPPVRWPAIADAIRANANRAAKQPAPVA
ncbi:MAG: alpha/beta fold hydrolase [Acidimicrobiia bacterium]|nr:alpha/beta fold hydrolase [Acidimicrobiia bacterium]